MKVYLKVPFEQKDAARRGGARWDQIARLWYILDRTAFHNCQQWYRHPLSADLKAWLEDPAVDQAYAKAMDQFMQEKAIGKYDHLPIVRSESKEKAPNKRSRQQNRKAAYNKEKARGDKVRKWKESMHTGKYHGPRSKIHSTETSGASCSISSVTIKLPF